VIYFITMFPVAAQVRICEVVATSQREGVLLSLRATHYRAIPNSSADVVCINSTLTLELAPFFGGIDQTLI
jgi:hypothetical protein